MLFDLLFNSYFLLGYGTPERKISIKVEKISKYHPEIMDLYVNNILTFEKDPVLSQIILNASIKGNESKKELVEKNQCFFLQGCFLKDCC
ncbi:hypothetical protein ACFTQ7_13085 [Lysinibacillus sp. NPDC056959]|uniref:hypothetical protein n=1 Tax=Lysinibacillus sp. NPDC056959 TaxID=3345981 RepID=UPI00362D2E5C